MNYPKNIFDEETKISYTLHGEYYLPDLSLPDMEKPDTENPYPGKYALAKYRFLRDHRKPLLRMLQSRFKLYSYLRQVEAECEDAYDRIEKELSLSEGVNEDLKANDQMAWIQRMNSIRNRAEEIVYSEYIYTD